LSSASLSTEWWIAYIEMSDCISCEHTSPK
jgi:hypothetical protein